MGVGSWELEVGSWKLEVGSWELGVLKQETIYSLLITHYSLLLTHYSLLITPYSGLAQQDAHRIAAETYGVDQHFSYCLSRIGFLYVGNSYEGLVLHH